MELFIFILKKLLARCDSYVYQQMSQVLSVDLPYSMHIWSTVRNLCSNKHTNKLTRSKWPVPTLLVMTYRLSISSQIISISSHEKLFSLLLVPKQNSLSPRSSFARRRNPPNSTWEYCNRNNVLISIVSDSGHWCYIPIKQRNRVFF